MVRLQRRGVAAPKSWVASVKGSFADYRSYRSLARSFERLALTGAKRRNGFSKFAGTVLPVRKSKRDFPPLWQKKDVKKALRGMTQGYCAYCQSPADASEYGRIDHYRPKALFPSLAYAWDNYFYSCELCNGTKHDKWPDSGEYVRPDRKDPSSRFEFKPDGSMTAVRQDVEATRTITDFGLNNRGLRKVRRTVITKAIKDIKAIVSSTKQGVPQQTARKLAQNYLKEIRRCSPYSTALKQNVRRAWNDAFPQNPI